MKIGILWDLDGTLLDTLADLCDAVNFALDRFGYHQRTLEEVRRFVGNGAGRLMALAVPGDADPAPVLAVFQEYYRDHCRIQTAPYPGVMDALDALGKKYPLAIVSNKPDGAVKSLCADFFPGIYARGEDGDCPRKPDPAMVYKAMEVLGAETCVYVGDSEVDIATAKNAGVPCVSVLWGFRDRAELESAGGERFCETAADLVEIIERTIRQVNSCV